MFRSLPQLEAYYWIARLGSFHAAAARLGLTQPSISIRIKELEADAGCALFTRSGGVVRLTEQGRAMFDHVERIILILNDLDGRVRSSGPLRGLLRFGVPDSFALTCLPHFIRIVGESHPELNVSVMVENSRLLAQKLEEGVLDVAIVVKPDSIGGLRLDPIGDQLLSWVAGPSISLPSMPLTVEDLSRLPIVTSPPPSPTYSILIDWFAESGLVPLRLSTCNSMSAIEKVILAGGGICFLPACVTQSQRQAGLLRELSVAPALPKQPMVIAYRKESASHTIPKILEAIHASIEGTGFVDAA